MEINLLPRQSAFEKYRLLLFLSIGSMLVGSFLYLWVLYVNVTADLSFVQAELNRAKSENTALQARLKPDPQTAVYESILTASDLLRKKQSDMVKMLDTISANLSPKSKISMAAYNHEESKLELTVHTESMNVVAEYAVLLKKNNWVKDVLIEQIKNESPNLLKAAQNEDSPYKDLPFRCKVIILLDPDQGLRATASAPAQTP
jgi:hypothetical protein